MGRESVGDGLGPALGERVTVGVACCSEHEGRGTGENVAEVAGRVRAETCDEGPVRGRWRTDSRVSGPATVRASQTGRPSQDAEAPSGSGRAPCHRTPGAWPTAVS